MFKSILFSAFSITLILPLASAFADDTAVVVESIDGGTTIEVSRAGVWAPVPVGTTVEPGDSLRTGPASARLVYADGSAVALSTASEVRIQPDPTRVIELVQGTVWGKIEKAPVAAAPNPGAAPNSVAGTAPGTTSPAAASTPVAAATGSPYKFTLHSKAAVMGVRGTEFLVESGATGEVAFHTLEGTVDTAPDLATLKAGRGVPVHKLERIRTRAGAPFGKAEPFKSEELAAHMGKDHPGLTRFLGKPIRRLKPDHSARKDARQKAKDEREEKRAARLRRKAEVKENSDGTLHPGQGTYGTPARRHR